MHFRPVDIEQLTLQMDEDDFIQKSIDTYSQHSIVKLINEHAEL